MTEMQAKMVKKAEKLAGHFKFLQELECAASRDNVAFATVDFWLAAWAAFPEEMARAFSARMSAMVKQSFGRCRHSGCEEEISTNPEAQRMGFCQLHMDEIDIDEIRFGSEE